MKLINTLSLALVASISALGCGAYDDFESPDSELDTLSQAATGSVTASVTLTAFSTTSLLIWGINWAEPPDPFVPAIFSLSNLSFTAPTRSTSSQALQPVLSAAESAVVEGKCGELAEQWSKVVNRQNWDDAKKQDYIVENLLPKMAKNKCTAGFTFFESDDGAKHVTKISFPPVK